MNKKLIIISCAFTALAITSCSEEEKMKSIPYDTQTEALPTEQGVDRGIINLQRAIVLVDSGITHHFQGSGMTMNRYYNPFTNAKSTEVGSVWMYTSAIQAVNDIMESLKTYKSWAPQLYEDNYQRFDSLLAQLYDNMDYYEGTYTLTSYTQTKEWSVYGVNRGSDKGGADVTGVLNVYDDQEWIIRELVRSYNITGKSDYLAKAEYLTSYVLDGWDCTPDDNGEEIGGITWGPAYMTKHSCSNGPMVSPLVQLYEIYQQKSDEITYRTIDEQHNRYEVTTTKADYYLTFAKKIYAWQKQHLIEPSGVYYDLIGATASEPQYETVNGVTYRKGVALTEPSGKAYTYNSGAMLSGCSDLYRVTKESSYLQDAVSLTDATFSTFAQKDKDVSGYYSYPISGFSTWFNYVLLDGYMSAVDIHEGASICIDTYQANLDYAWANFRRNGTLPTNLLIGWNLAAANNNMEGMFSFAYASEYAMLAAYQARNSSN